MLKFHTNKRVKYDDDKEGQKYQRFTLKGFSRKTFDELELMVGDFKALHLIRTDCQTPYYALIMSKWLYWYNKNQQVIPRPNQEVAVYGHFTSFSNENESYFYIVIGDITQEPILIAHPNFEINVTDLTISKKFYCGRRFYLKNKYFGTRGFKFSSLLIGTLYHQVFEKVMLMDDNNLVKNLNMIVEDVLNKNIMEYASSDFEETFDLKNKLDRMAQKSYKFKYDYFYHKREIMGNHGDKFIIEDILTTEHPFVSEKFAIKGKIDLLLKCRHYPVNFYNAFNEVIIPLDLKTGNVEEKDQLQVIIYNFCFFENQDEQRFSFLLYIQDNIDIVIVQNSRKRFHKLMTMRNVLANIIHDKRPPPITKSLNNCLNCNYKKQCVYEIYFERLKKFEHFEDVDDIEDILAKDKPNVKLLEECKKKSIVTKNKIAFAREKLEVVTEQEDQFEASKLLRDKCILTIYFDLYYANNMHKFLDEADCQWVLCQIVVKKSQRKSFKAFKNYLAPGKDLYLKNKFVFDKVVEGEIMQRTEIDVSDHAIFDLTLRIKRETISEFFGCLEKYRENFNHLSRFWYIFNKEEDLFKRMRTNILNFVSKKDNDDFFKFFWNTGDSVFDHPKNSNAAELDTILGNFKWEKYQMSLKQKDLVRLCIKTENVYLIHHSPSLLNPIIDMVLFVVLIVYEMNKNVLIVYQEKSLKDLFLNRISHLFDGETRTRLLRDMWNVSSKMNHRSIEEFRAIMNKKIFYSNLFDLVNMKFVKRFFEYLIILDCSNIIEPFVLQTFTLSKKIIIFGDLNAEPKFPTNRNDFCLSSASFFKSLFNKYSTQGKCFHLTSL